MSQLEQFVTPVDMVVSRMRAVRASLPERDGVAVFNRVYLAVTEEIERRLEAGEFPDTEAVVTLDVRFAERYLRVAEEGPRPPAGGRCSNSGAIPGYARCSSRSRASMRTSDTIWRSPSWTPVVRSAANQPMWRTSSSAWVTSSSRWRSASAKI